MTEQPGNYTTQSEQPLTIDSLKRKCHGLIEQVARRPGAIKLLLGIRLQAQMFADYKANRSYQRLKP
jgi:hypothetical protein